MEQTVVLVKKAWSALAMALVGNLVSIFEYRLKMRNVAQSLRFDF